MEFENKKISAESLVFFSFFTGADDFVFSARVVPLFTLSFFKRKTVSVQDNN